MGAWGPEWGSRPPPVFASTGKNRQSSSYSANSSLFRPYKNAARDKNSPTPIIPPPITSLPAGKNCQNQNRTHPTKMPRLRASSLFAVWQTGADCTFYYHFNGAILAVRLALTRLPWQTCLKELSDIANCKRTND